MLLDVVLKDGARLDFVTNGSLIQIDGFAYFWS